MKGISNANSGVASAIPQQEIEDIINDVFYPALPVPENVSVSGNVVSYEAVAGAEEYVIYVDGDEIGRTLNTSIDLTTLQGWNDLPDGTYDITVGATADGYTRIKQSSAVSVVKESPEPPAEEYFLTFSSPSSFTIAMPYLANDGALEYSLDKESWSSWDGSETASNSNNKFYLRGSENTTFGGQSFEFNGENIFIACTGNIENLLDYQTVANGQHPVMGDTCFSNLFNEYGKTPALVTAPTLPATVLSMGCYYQMFAYCTLLTTAPELPATTLADFCYQGMFNGCTNLTAAPELSATTLAKYCCSLMFQDCASLTTVPELPPTTLVNNCYWRMFKGCTSLYVSDTQTAEAQYEWRIPTNAAITGTTYSQAEMFYNCLGTRSSNNLAGEVGQQYIYYTQNPPVGSN